MEISYKYISTKFSGSFSRVIQLLEEKKILFECKQAENEEFQIKCPENYFEAVLVALQAFNANNDTEDKITKINEITATEYEPKKNEMSKVDKGLIIDQVPSIKKEDDIINRIAVMLNDTVLPSKSPLPKDDPFSFLISQRYLRSFFIVVSVLLFILALME